MLPLGSHFGLCEMPRTAVQFAALQVSGLKEAEALPREQGVMQDARCTWRGRTLLACCSSITPHQPSFATRPEQSTSLGSPMS